MSAEEREAAVDLLACTPDAGNLIVGTGGCRKVRLGGRGKGKSGGYRLITTLVHDGRVFLMTVFSKGARADLSQAERNALAAIVRTLVEGDNR